MRCNKIYNAKHMMDEKHNDAVDKWVLLFQNNKF